jgi:hypothetical protein
VTFKDTTFRRSNTATTAREAPIFPFQRLAHMNGHALTAARRPHRVDEAAEVRERQSRCTSFSSGPPQRL